MISETGVGGGGGGEGAGNCKVLKRGIFALMHATMLFPSL